MTSKREPWGLSTNEAMNCDCAIILSDKVGAKDDLIKIIESPNRSKDLELLNNIATIEWAKNWIHDMVSYGDSFPKFMYQDMFKMRDFSQKNNTKNYF